MSNQSWERPPRKVTPKLGAQTSESERVETVKRSTTLPSGVFRTCDPDVEAALNESIAVMFLREMAAGTVQSALDDGPPPPPREKVSQDEIQRFMNSLCAHEETPVPRLDEHVPGEFVGVLTYLALKSTGIARQRSTAELRDVVGSIERGEFGDAETIESLDEFLGDCTGRPLLLQILHNATRAARRMLEDHE